MRFQNAARGLCLFFAFYLSAYSAEVHLTGTVKDNANNGLSDAKVSLLNAGLSATTNGSGEFAITGTIPDIGTKFNGKKIRTAHAKPVFNGSQVLFSIASLPQKVKIEVYDIKGKLLGTVLEGRLGKGSYSVSPLAGLKAPPASMLFIVRVRIGPDCSSLVIPHFSSSFRRSYAGLRHTTDITTVQKYAPSATVDTLEVTLCGYVLSRQPIESFTESGIAVTMVQSSLDSATEATIDSLFDALSDQIGSLDSIDSPDQFKSKDFAALRDGFDEILSSKDSYHMKASVGYIVSAVLALNTNESFWKLVDSLDAYFTALDSSGAPMPRALRKNSALMKQSLVKDGITGLGKSLAAVSWTSLALTAADPSFPKFITLSYIQSIAENDVVPVLNNVIATCGRMESCGDRLLLLEVESDTFEIDKGEVHLLDAWLRLLRAGLNSFCIYDMNIYAQGTTDYSWIDSLRHLESSYRDIYRISGDTLYSIWTRDEVRPMSFVFTLIKYNMERQGFLIQRKANGQMVKNDLLAIPATIKTGMAYIRAETDNQSNDIIKISDLMNADRDLADVPQKMIDDGVSPSLANKFRSPESIADFVTELLSGPYTFDEMTTDSIRINITINLTAMLDTAVYDLRTLFPKHQWLPDSEWVVRMSDYYSVATDSSTYFYFDDDDTLAFSDTLIDSIISVPGSSSRCVLKSPYRYVAYADSMIMVIPLCLFDDQGNRVNFEDIPDMVEAKTFFPWFDDYTMGGVFPEMTRQKWLDLIYQE